MANQTVELTDDQFIEAAKDLTVGEDLKIEIDDERHGVVYREPSGAWVRSWIWVANDDAKRNVARNAPSLTANKERKRVMFEQDEMYLASLKGPSQTKPEVVDPTNLFGDAAIMYLADALHSEKWKFTMSSNTVASCETAGCIAGHAAAIWDDCNYCRHFLGEEITKRLGIDESTFDKMCIYVNPDGKTTYADSGNRVGFSNISAKIAAAMLRNYVSTRRVEWKENV